MPDERVPIEHLPVEMVTRRIYVIRGQRVMLDSDLADLYRGDQSWGLDVVNAVDQRSNVSFRYYSTGSPFEYETIRFLYVRKQLLEDAGLHPQDKPKKRGRQKSDK